MRLRQMMLRTGQVITLAAVTQAACGEGCLTEPCPPDDRPPNDSVTDITGSWRFDSSFRGSNNLSTANLSLTMDGTSVSGTHTNTKHAYQLPCDPIVGCIGAGTITPVPDGPVTGNVQGTTVVLEFNADGEGEIDRFEGAVDGDKMSGSKWKAVKTGGGGASQGPTLTGLQPASGPVGPLVVLKGTQLSFGVPPIVSLDGSTMAFVYDHSESSIRVLMTNAGAAGAHSVVVSVGDTQSNDLTWTQQGDQDPTEPANDQQATAPMVNLPSLTVGSFLGGDFSDAFKFSLATPTTVRAELGWNTAKDLDLWVLDIEGSDACGNGGATERRSELIECALQAGEYFLWVDDYDARMNADPSLVSYWLGARIL